jgi:hypothetical protein
MHVEDRQEISGRYARSMPVRCWLKLSAGGDDRRHYGRFDFDGVLDTRYAPVRVEQPASRGRTNRFWTELSS